MKSRNRYLAVLAHRPHVRLMPLIVAAISAAVGILTLSLSGAATFASSSEAEDGQVTSPASAVQDSLASGGQAVRFGQSASALPEKLAIYYGNPANVNSAGGNLATAAGVFDDYDMVIFGEGIEQAGSAYHANTQTIIQNIADTTRTYGYVDTCVQNPQSSLYRCSNFTEAELKGRTDKWKAMGAKGIFLDQAGCEYLVSRSRLNATVDYIHSQGMSAFVNVWNPPDAFAPGSVPSPYGSGYADCNPTSLASSLGPSDYMLLESWAVVLSDWSENYAADPNATTRRGQQMLQYKQSHGVKVASVNTIGYNNPPFSQAQLDYTWWTSLLYGLDAMGWGETWVFSSDTDSLPYRARPNPGNIGSSILPIAVTSSGNLFSRPTTGGTIRVDMGAHTGEFGS